MDQTKETKKDINIIVETAIERKIEQALAQLKRDITEIKRVLVGDSMFNERGMKIEHDEIYKYCQRLQDEDVFRKVQEHAKLVGNFRFLFTFIGANSVVGGLALILAIINFIKTIGLS